MGYTADLKQKRFRRSTEPSINNRLTDTYLRQRKFKLLPSGALASIYTTPLVGSY